MNPIAHRNPAPRKRTQRGSLLFVVLLLLLLASILTIFALNVGTFEQRLSGNDLRARYTQQLADSAIAEAIEFIRLQGPDFIQFGAPSWTICPGDDDSFPCGALPDDRRAGMYYYSDGGGDPLLSRLLIPYDQARFQNVGSIAGDGFPVEYGAGAAICWISRNATDDAECATRPEDASNIFVLTMVGLARMPEESARATATQTLAAYTLFDNLPNVPPIVAAGTLTLRGNIDVVVNPNAAGPGVPVSVWTRMDVDPNGTPNTCYIDEFLREGAPNAANQGPRFHPDTDFVVCAGCQCPENKSLSFGGVGGDTCPGIDILAPNKARSAGCPPTAHDIDPSNPQEFPCDLFEYVFGIEAWEDRSNPADNFCETKIFVENRLDSDNGTEIGADVAFLIDSARWIIGNAPAGLAGDPRLRACGDFASVSGLVWVRGCDISGEIGSPDNPALLVVDGGQTVRFNADSRLFGVLFGRDSSCDGPRPIGGPDCAIDPTTGGNASIRLNGGAQIYGAAVAQGEVDGSGSNAVIYSAEVMRALATNPENFVFNSLPGSWTDLVRY